MELMKKEMLDNTPHVNMTVPKVEINSPVINIQAPKITVNPVVNLHSQDLIQRSDGKIKVPEIVVNLSTSTSDFSAKW